MAGRPRIHVYTLTWNEEFMLPFFLRHYEKFCEEIVVYDNASTDRTPEIIEAHAKAHRCSLETDNEFRDDIHAGLKSTVWKQSVGVADWVIVVDCDEFVLHPDLPKFLSQASSKGIDVVVPQGYEMVSYTEPRAGRQIYESIARGRPDIGYSKAAVFAPDSFAEVTFSPGAHSAQYVSHGPEFLRLETREVALANFKYIGGHEFVLRRFSAYAQRLSAINRKNRWGYQYDFSPKQVQDMFTRLDRDAHTLPMLPAPKRRTRKTARE